MVKEKLTSFMRGCVLALFAVMLLWMIAAAGTSTARITADYAEHTLLVADSLWANLGAAALFFLFVLLCDRGLAALLRRAGKQAPDILQSPGLRKGLLIAVGVLGVFYVLATQRISESDQYVVAKVADLWTLRDFHAFDIPGEYWDLFPNQWGLSYVEYLFSLVFGSYNYMAFQLMNVGFLVWFYRLLMRLTDLMVEEERGRRAGTLLLMLGLLFFPLILYSNFVYGTIIGLALSTAALVQLEAVRREFSVRRTIAACLLQLGAVVVKQNYLIFALGFIIILAIHMIETSNWRLSIPCVGLAAVVLFSGSLINAAIWLDTGRTPREDGGLSPLSYIEMGLHENIILYDGWWDRSTINSYQSVDCSRKAQAELSKEQLKARLSVFAEDPAYALRFFAGKNTSQWNNPEFQSLWISQIRASASASHVPPAWVEWLYGFEGTEAVSGFLNRMQFIVLAGVILFMALCRPKGFIAECLCVTVLGGFIFHSFWEAKPQYTLPYFELLLPLAALGWAAAADRARKAVPAMRDHALKPDWRTAALPAIALAVMILAQTGAVPLLNDTVRRTEDTVAYSAFQSNGGFRGQRLPEGRYRVTCVGKPGLFLSVRPSE